MSDLYRFSLNAIKEGKVTSETVIKLLSEEITDPHVYRVLYKSIYGKKINDQLADEWVKSMAVTDESDRVNGQKWTKEQTTEVGTKIGIDWHDICKTDFYVVMNMVYSDYYDELHSLGADVTHYAKFALKWLKDRDVSPDKLFNYYFNVVC